MVAQALNLTIFNLSPFRPLMLDLMLASIEAQKL